MVDTIILYIYYFMQIFSMVFLWREIGKPKKGFIIILSISFAALLLHDVIFQYMMNLGRMDFPSNIVQTLIFFAIICLLYKGGVKEKFKLISVTVIVSIIASLLGTLIETIVFGSTMSQISEPNELLSVILGIGSDMLLIGCIFSILIIKRKDENYKRLRIYLLIMIGFVLVHMIFFIFYYTNRIDKLNNRDIIVQLVFQSMLPVLLIMLYYTMKKNIENIKTEEMLAQIDESMQRTHEYYTLARSQYDEISRIRHDMNNHLGTAAALIKDNQQSEAQEIIEKLRTSLDGIKAVQYCENPVINTILIIKANQSEYKGIDMQFTLKDCEKIPCDSAELCSLTFNLFDNAARAALESGRKPVVQMESGVMNEYFVLKITNTAKENALSSGTHTPTTKKAKGHGYGMSIVKMIAEKYDGSFTLEQEGEFVTGTILLKQK